MALLVFGGRARGVTYAQYVTYTVQYSRAIDQTTRRFSEARSMRAARGIPETDPPARARSPLLNG